MDFYSTNDGVARPTNVLESPWTPVQGPSSDPRTPDQEAASPERLASSTLSPDWISYSGIRPAADGLPRFQLYTLDSLLQAIRSGNSESATEAISQPGMGKVPFEPTVAAVNSVIHKRPVQKSEASTSDLQNLSDESLFHTGAKVHQELFDALDFTATPKRMQQNIQYLEPARPVQQKANRTPQKTKSKKSRGTLRMLFAMPNRFVLLRHSISQDPASEDFG